MTTSTTDAEAIARIISRAMLDNPTGGTSEERAQKRRAIAAEYASIIAEALTAPGATTKSDGVEGHADPNSGRSSRASHLSRELEESGIKPGPSDTRPADVTVDELASTLRNVIEAADRALGDHIAPHDCFATGPRTGDPFADLVVCPGCVQRNEIAKARALLDTYKIGAK